MARSAPRARHAATFSADAVTAIRAPTAFAIWMAAVPTPEAPAWTSAVRPGVSPPWATSASNAVMNASGIAAASSMGDASGIDRSIRSWVTSRSA